MDRTQQPGQRELVFCHQCENEWYRDEHGIICPECQSDFTEIIEAGHDPRQASEPPQSGADHEFYAPDPDEADIDDVHWQNHGPGEPPGGRFTGTFTRNIHLGPNGPQGGMAGGGAGSGGGLLGLIGPALQGMLGGQRQGGPPQDEWTHGARGDQRREASGWTQGQYQQQQGENGGTWIRHGSGPGYSFTITTSSNGNLFPRNANAPQPFQNQPDHLERMMAQMFANIGAMPGHGFGGGGMRGGPLFMEMGGRTPGTQGGGPGMSPFGNLFQMLGIPAGGVHGDAVYSQEALDRIISQLMEQHRSGNAPGPASADAIESLPQRPITQKHQGDNGKADCSICMDEAELGSLVTELPCGHWFHHDCIKAWLGEHDTCPHCRQGIMPKDEPNTNRARQPSQAPLNDMHSPEYQRPHNPDEYPFPRTNSATAEGSDAAGRRNSNSSGGGLFSRMRQAFSPGGSAPPAQPDRNNGDNPFSG